MVRAQLLVFPAGAKSKICSVICHYIVLMSYRSRCYGDTQTGLKSWLLDEGFEEVLQL
jgi:hypothetical protein